MSGSHIALALALAISFGVAKPTLSPLREVPLSKSDILIADNANGQGSAKMGNGSASDTPSGQTSNEEAKSDKMTGSGTK